MPANSPFFSIFINLSAVKKIAYSPQKQKQKRIKIMCDANIHFSDSIKSSKVTYAYFMFMKRIYLNLDGNELQTPNEN